MELINEKFVACCQRAVQDFRLRESGLRESGLRESAEASAEELGPDRPGQAGGYYVLYRSPLRYGSRLERNIGNFKLMKLSILALGISPPAEKFFTSPFAA